MRKILGWLVAVMLLASFFIPYAPVHAYELEEPECVDPRNGEYVWGDDLEFVWECDEDGDDVEDFRLQVYEDDWGDPGDRIFDEYVDEGDCDEWDDGGEYSYVVDIGGGFAELDLDNNETYWWRVRANPEDNDDDSSDWSNWEDFRWAEFGRGPGIEISPARGPHGTTITVWGYEWEDGEDIELFFDGEEVSDFRTRDEDWRERISGNDWRGVAGYGMKKIYALGDETGRSNYAWFDVIPPDASWDLHPLSGLPGRSVSASGDYWPLGDYVTVLFDGDKMGTENVEEDGDWRLRFDVPDIAPGTYTVQAYSDSISRRSVESYRFEVEEEDTVPEVIGETFDLPRPVPWWPTDGAKVGRSPTIQWSYGGPIEGVLFEIRIAVDADYNQLVWTNVVDGFEAKPRLLSDGTHYWQVRATSGSDISDWSKSYSFSSYGVSLTWLPWAGLAFFGLLLLGLFIWIIVKPRPIVIQQKP